MNKQRIPPSARLRRQIEEFLGNGLEGAEDPLGELIRLRAQLVVQEALERETTERLGRAHYQRREPGEPLRGYRNGYERGRLRTAQGEIEVQVPQVREWAEEGSYRSADGVLAWSQRSAGTVGGGDVRAGVVGTGH